ncbi:MAG: GtrA family protein [Lachnospiraceae bacterium]|nr:GtrA family protein [Lachnospiraceae bacterium]MEE1256895.1 GtrA family protein [Lachnospiraceae bacterium]
MKKLVEQIMKFGAVGFLCFFIDYLVGLVVLHVVLGVGVFGENSFSMGSQIGSALGFTVSVIVNYILSFKFVFERKEDMNRKAEFVIFIILSVIGLGLNQVVMWICTVLVYNNVEWIQKLLGYGLAFTVAKVIATAIVMVYNFITRKIFLEKK